MNRTAEVTRTTGETEISLRLRLDGTGQGERRTGVGFFDHMLDAVARHGRLDLEVEARGDLETGAHHLTEDIGIVLGQALDQALGDRSGIRRYGDALVPMDEALALVAVDLSGRGYAVIDAEFGAPLIGTMASSLIAHFCETLAARARMNLHAKIFYGRDDHHKAEALFKALGRALALAVAIEPRRERVSSKGTLK
jgi:imidazoleglycerol-phosphate dehydratase